MSVPLISVAEIFGPTIQGEGSVIGLPTVFVRTGGCDYRCSWCDSLHAVLPEYRREWKKLAPGAIVETVLGLTGGRGILVTLSGGNPALQPLAELITEGRKAGLRFALETQGSRPQQWMADLDHLVLSPKPPSSGEEPDRGALLRCIGIAESGNAEVTVKVVVFDAVDLAWALALHRDLQHDVPGLPFCLQVGNEELMPVRAEYNAADVRRYLDSQRGLLLQRLEWLSEAVIEARAFGIRVLPQLHTLMWGNARGK